MSIKEISLKVYQNGEALNLDECKELLAYARHMGKAHPIMDEILQNWFDAMALYMGHAGLKKEQVAKDLKALRERMIAWLDTATPASPAHKEEV